MARPLKCRRVCCVPEKTLFGPLNCMNDKNEIVKITVDEYEVIRLMDLIGLTQEACASQMKVARTTVQRLYSDARKKMAESFINGKTLKIEGGHYQECTGKNTECCNKPCFKLEQ